MDWLWPIYQEHITRQCERKGTASDEQAMQSGFFSSLGNSTATLFVMEPIGDTIRFMGLGRWRLAEVSDLLSDPNAFIAERFGGGKYKINFHDGLHFVGTHNFRTWGEELWRNMEEVEFDE
jgi:hypothetical protein